MSHPLAAIKTFPQLVKYLRDELDWPIDSENIDDLTFDYDPVELGIDPKNAAKIKPPIKQLRPFKSGQPWGIFFVNFEPKRLPIVVLRKMLGGLVFKRRASANPAERAAWNLHDLLFISAFGEGDERQMTLAHFSESAARDEIPTLKVLGWDGLDTQLTLQHTERELKDKLAWREGEAVEAWRKRWSSAFTQRPRQVIATAKDLAATLADLAKQVRSQVAQVLSIETERGPLRKLYAAFREALIHDLNEDGFADMYAQTITYGLFSAAAGRTTPDAGTIVQPQNLADMVPVTNPFLKEMLETFLTAGGRKGKLDFDELGIQEVVEVLNAKETDLSAVLRDFGNLGKGEDPVIHFYEDFLREYDKELKVRRGVFYTPQPVVSYIVRSVHELLQTEFGLEDGLASTMTWREYASQHPGVNIPTSVVPNSPFVTILDPATGTATFLVEVIDVIYKTMKARWTKEGHLPLEMEKLWNEYVPKHLLPRLYGYELMMAPYAIAHMKLGLKLHETGYRFGSNERARIYLTNALEPWVEQLPLIGFDALAHEAAAVNEVKRNKRFTVVIGNPPYAGWSANLTPDARAIVERYKFVGEDRIQEKGALQFEKNLQDDYVKYFAWSEKTATASGVGVLSFVSNHGFLETPTLRGMRWHLLHSFSDHFLLDLHGSTKRPIDDDDNVFDIQQGVAISVLAKNCAAASVTTRRADLIGTRSHKYDYLSKNSTGTTEWKSILPAKPFYQFLALDSAVHSEFRRFTSLTDAMPFYSTGTETGFDSLMVDFTKDELLSKVRRFLDPRKSDGQVAEEFAVGEGTGRKLLEMRDEFRRDFGSAKDSRCVRGMYRVFDTRIYYYKKEYLKTNSFRVMRNLLESENLALIAFRQQSQDGFQHAFVTNMLGDKNAVSLRTREINYYFPLRVLPEDDALRVKVKPTLNFDPAFLARLAQALGIKSTDASSVLSGIGPEEVVHYIYAVLHSPGYRTRYAEFLKIDFPRLPLTSSLDLFCALAKLGGELVAFHLLESPKLAKPLTEFIGKSREVEKVGWTKDGGGSVWIDASGTKDAPRPGANGFRGVSDAVWNFHIGGYQVCEKWLKDRKGRTLTKDDIAHYHKIVVALAETIRLMAEIDRTIDAHGGWPGAFA